MKVNTGHLLALSAFASVGSGLQLDINNSTSIKNAASKVAHGLMERWFKGEQSAITAGFELPADWFWWEAGELWTGMLNYWSYTNDTTYLSPTHQYLQAQIGTAENWMLESHRYDEANDDQSHWGFAAMTAAEKNFPKPDSPKPSWIQTVKNFWDFQVKQWDNTTCHGGLRWGITPGDTKYTYKNTITNGGFFQISARLAMYTGDAKYSQWATKTFEWVQSSGLLTKDYKVLDGIHVETCTDLTHDRWSINHGIFLYGAAVMYKHTGLPIWKQHVDGLLNAASTYYFNAPGGHNTVMWEPDCERSSDSCNNDQKIFKSSLARYLYETAVVAPHTSGTIFALLENSVKGAANACVGGAGGNLCGAKWYADDDKAYGPASQLAALEVIQGMLLKGVPSSSTNTAKDHGTGDTLVKTIYVDASKTAGDARVSSMEVFSVVSEPGTVLYTDTAPIPSSGVAIILNSEGNAICTGVVASPPILSFQTKAIVNLNNETPLITMALMAIASTETNAASPTLTTPSTSPTTTVTKIQQCQGYQKIITTSPNHKPNSSEEENVITATEAEREEENKSPKFSSDSRSGPSFALFVFCAFLGFLGVIF